MNIITKLLASVDGWKTYIASAALLLTGLAQLLTALQHLLDGGFTVALPEIQAAFITLGQALAAFGLRQAVAKASVAASGQAA